MNDWNEIPFGLAAGGLLSGQAPFGYGPLSEEDMKRARQQGLLAAGLGILAANRPGTPASSAIGQGGLVGLTSMNQARRDLGSLRGAEEQRQIMRDYRGAQAAKIQEEQRQRQAALKAQGLLGSLAAGIGKPMGTPTVDNAADPQVRDWNSALNDALSNPETAPFAIKFFEDLQKATPEYKWEDLGGRKIQTVRGTPTGKEMAKTAGLGDIPYPMQGLTPEQARAFKLMDSRAGATTVSNSNTFPRQETEFEKEVGKEYGKQYAKIQESGINSGPKLARLARMEQLLVGVETGKLTPAMTEVAALFESFGLKLDPKLNAKQAIDSLSNEMALELRNPSGGAGMPGAMSDQDREFLKKMVAGLKNTPGANTLIIDTHRRLAQRDADVARLATEYRKTRKDFEGFSDHLKKWADQNPLFPEAAQEQPQAQPTSQNVIKYDAKGNRIK